MMCAVQLLKEVLGRFLILVGLCIIPPWARADAVILHTYAVSRAHEIDNLIAVDASKLAKLLPPDYVMVSAADLGVGGPNQGVVVIVNFEGLDPVVDDINSIVQSRIGIDVAILVDEPTDATEAGVAVPGAFHLYTLAMYSNEAPYVAKLKRADTPIKFVTQLTYQRTIDDVSGIGDLTVNVPLNYSSFASFNTAFGYGPPTGPLHAIFWHDGHHGRTALHFDVPVFRQGNGISNVFTQPGSALGTLLEGGGAGPCPPDPDTGLTCVIAPSVSFSFDQGDTGELLLIR